jgi:hypothetical protein
MANLDIKTDIQGPDQIKINLVREDHLDTSNIFRICFEVFLAIGCAILGSIISLLNDNKIVPFMNWFFLGLMVLCCISFLILSIVYYKNAKCKTKTKTK